MIGWLYRLIIGRFSFCKHKWVNQGDCEVYGDSSMPKGFLTTLKCKNCGDVKTIKRYA